ncbi:hypothetical protein QUA07_20350 [Microcoleus sp. T3_A4]|uniref:hypothetical protein n=1 Tax=Microcoleus sp. T3_A4 TaxID=2818968 RepID=UPI002FD46A86
MAKIGAIARWWRSRSMIFLTLKRFGSWGRSHLVLFVRAIAQNDRVSNYNG